MTKKAKTARKSVIVTPEGELQKAWAIEAKVSAFLLTHMQSHSKPPKSAKFGIASSEFGSGTTIVFVQGNRAWAWRGTPLEVQGRMGMGYNIFAPEAVAALVDAGVLTKEEQAVWLTLQVETEDRRQQERAIEKLHEEARRLGYSVLKNPGGDRG